MNPCFKCQDRFAGDATHPSCHAGCERYKAWKSDEADKKSKIRKAKDSTKAFGEVVKNGFIK